MGTYTDASDVSDELQGYAIDSTSTPSSTVVEGWITEAEAEINDRTHNVYTSTTVSSEIYDWDNVGDGIFRLSYSPIISVTTLEYNSSGFGDTPTWSTKTEGDAADFIVYEEQGEIEFVTKNFSPSSGTNRFRMTFNYGTSSVPLTVKTLATKIVARRVVGAIINNQGTEGGGTVKVGTIEVTEPAAFTMNLFDKLGTEIEDLYSKVLGTFQTFRNKRVYQSNGQW